MCCEFMNELSKGSIKIKSQLSSGALDSRGENDETLNNYTPQRTVKTPKMALSLTETIISRERLTRRRS